MLAVNVELHREFSHGLLAAYIDLKKAFDLLHRESLWEMLILRGIIGLIASHIPAIPVTLSFCL